VEALWIWEQRQHPMPEPKPCVYFRPQTHTGRSPARGTPNPGETRRRPFLLPPRSGASSSSSALPGCHRSEGPPGRVPGPLLLTQPISCSDLPQLLSAAAAVAQHHPGRLIASLTRADAPVLLPPPPRPPRNLEQALEVLHELLQFHFHSSSDFLNPY
jgi:hypothetical protein